MDNPNRSYSFVSSKRTDDQQPSEEEASLSAQANRVDNNDEDFKPETSSVAEQRIIVHIRTINGNSSEDGEQALLNNDGADSVFTAETNQTQIGGASNNRKTSKPSQNQTAEVLVENSISQSYGANLPSLPDSSLQDGEKSNSGERIACLVTGRSREEKIPAENFCQLSFQVPSPGIKIKVFIMEKTCTERNEKTFFFYLIPEEDCKVYEEICREFKNGEAFSRQIPLTLNGGRSEDFHTFYVHETIKVELEIENSIQGNIVPLNQGNESVFRVPVIKSESESRLAKGSKCQFVVQYVGEPGKACQEQGKATLTIDSNYQTTLFFSISFWCSRRTNQT